MDIEQVYAAESMYETQHDITREWETIRLPYPLNLNKYQANANLAMAKSMLTQMDLKNGQDYIFCRNANEDFRTNVYLKFKNSGDGLIAVMRWLASDWYRKQQ